MFDLTPRERVKKARIKLLREKPFFGYALMHVHLVSRNDPKPRGPKIVYSEEFVKQLGDDELQAVLAHELLHYLLGHIKRAKAARRKFNAEQDRAYYQRMNIAQDMVVNAILTKNGFTLPGEKVIVNGDEIKVRQGAIIPKIEYSSRRFFVSLVDAEGKGYEVWDPEKKSAEEVYWEIKDFAVGDGVDGDDSDTMYFSDDETDDMSGDGDGDSESQKDGGQDDQGQACSGPKGKVLEELLSEAYTYAKMQGKAPAGFERFVTELLKPKVDWKALLRNYMAKMIPHDYSYLKPSKKSPPGIFLPGVVKSEHVEGLVAVDTSGSISEDELNQFISEIKWLARNFSVDLTFVSCDAEIQSEQQIRSRYDAERVRPKGGGGTDFRPVFDLATRKRARVVVYLTDGHGKFPDKRPIFPVIWVVTERGAPESQFPFGKVVKMS